MFKSLNRYFAKHGRATLLVLLVLIVVPFVFFGQRSTGASMFGTDSYGTLFGKPVRTDAFQLQLYGLLIDTYNELPRNLEREKLKFVQQFHEGVLNRMRILHLAEEQGFAHVTDEQLRDAIREFPPFRKDGEFSWAEYNKFEQEYLPKQTFTMADFEQMMRDNIVIARFHERFKTLTLNEAQIRAEYLQTRMQPEVLTRDFNYYSEDPKTINVTDAEIRKAFEAQKNKGGNYYVPPKRALLVARFKATFEPPKTEVTDEQVKAAYDARRETEYKKDEVKASHILIKFGRDDSDAVKQEKLKKASEILKEVKAGKQDFATLAKKHSEDVVANRDGGSLGFFARGDMVKPFADAAFKLKQGEISDIVETSFGYHIIKKFDTRTHVPFEEVKSDLRYELQREAADAFWEEQAKAVYEAELKQDADRKPEDRKYIRKQHRLLILTIANEPGATDEDRKLNRDKAEKIRQEAKTKDFAALVKKYSDGPEKDKGGDLGFVSDLDLNGRSHLKQAFDLKRGEVSKVLEGAGDFHIIKKVAEKTGPVPFDSVKNEIISDLRREKDKAAAQAADEAAAAFYRACNDIVTGGKLDATKAGFRALARKHDVELIETGYFTKDSQYLPKINGSAAELVKTAQTLTPARPISTVLKSNDDYRYIACLAGEKAGRIPRLAEVREDVKRDLRRGKQKTIVRQKADKLREQIKSALDAGKSFESLPESKRFFKLPPANPYRRDPRRNQVMEVARKTPANNVTIINTNTGATVIYVKGHAKPDPQGFENVAGAYRFGLTEYQGRQMAGAYVQELAKRYEFQPHPDYERLFTETPEDRF